MLWPCPFVGSERRLLPCGGPGRPDSLALTDFHGTKHHFTKAGAASYAAHRAASGGAARSG
jgi:hypothetical protein